MAPLPPSTTGNNIHMKIDSPFSSRIGKNKTTLYLPRKIHCLFFYFLLELQGLEPGLDPIPFIWRPRGCKRQIIQQNSRCIRLKGENNLAFQALFLQLLMGLPSLFVGLPFLEHGEQWQYTPLMWVLPTESLNQQGELIGNAVHLSCDLTADIASQCREKCCKIITICPHQLIRTRAVLITQNLIEQFGFFIENVDNICTSTLEIFAE